MVQASQSDDARSSFLLGLDDRISAIEDNWKQLSATWVPEQLDDLYSRISELTEESEELELHQLSESLISLEVYLSSFVDSPKRPSGEQQEAVTALIRTLRTSAEAPTTSPLLEEEELPPLPQAAREPSPEEEVPADSGITDSLLTEAGGEAPLLLFTSDGGPACEVVEALTQHGCELHSFASAPELVDEVKCRRNCLILTDNRMLTEIETVQEALNQARSQHSVRPPMVFVSDSSDLPSRLRAMRAGGDAYFVTPLDATEVAHRVVALTSPCLDHPCRIMVVEDDIAQANFAASILRKAKMEVMTVTEPMQVVDQLLAFQPDLILMDIYMPEVNGIELTAIIRDFKEFVATPIVFLSGEQSADKQMDALSVGGDDFISKPIRPKHLLHVVNHRIRRVNNLQNALGRRERKQHIGLVDKPRFLSRLSNILEQGGSGVSAIFHLIPDQLASIRGEHGLGAQDSLLGQFVQHLATSLGQHDLICRLDDQSITLLVRCEDEAGIESLAGKLCEGATQTTFKLSNAEVDTTVSLGICRLQREGEELQAAGAIARAVRACNQAQEDGGNRFLQHTPAPPIPEDEQTQALRKAVLQNELVVMFQPLLDLQTRGSHNYELLVHLASEEGDLQDLQQLRDVAARAGLLEEIDRWSMQRALDVLAEEQSSERKVRLFVSQYSLPGEEQLAWMREELQQRQIQGNELVLEYHLASVSKNIESAKAMATRLREMGIGLSLTRFSEKAAAFKVLRMLSGDYIRVAQRLLKADRETISQIINQAHQLKAQVIVSNVDDPRSIDLHWSSGADYLQGNFIQQPLDNMDYDFSQVVI